MPWTVTVHAFSTVYAVVPGAELKRRMSVSRISTGLSSRSVVSNSKLASTQGPAAATTSPAAGGEEQVTDREDLLRVAVGLGATGVASGLKAVDSTDGENFVVSNPLQWTGSSLARQPHPGTVSASPAPVTGDIGGDDSAPGGAPDLSASLHVPHPTSSSSGSGGHGAGEKSSPSRWPALTGRSGHAGVATGLEGFRSQRVGKAMRLGSPSSPPAPPGGHTQQHHHQ